MRKLAFGLVAALLSACPAPSQTDGGVTLAAPAGLLYTPAELVCTVGVSCALVGPANAGGAVESWSILPSLPAGLSFSTTTGVIAGTPSAASPSTTYLVTATNSGGFATTNVTLTVNDVAPTMLTWATNPASYTQGIAITPNVPSNSGGAVTQYQVSPALPAGLVLDPVTGIISGTPTALSPSASHVMTATNSGGSTTASLTLSVRPPAPVITPPASLAVPLGVRATFSVTATGTGTLTYQWKRGGMVMMGVTTASFSINAAVLANDGDQYSVDVSDSYGNTTTSSAATLTVSPATFTQTTTSPARSRILHTATLLLDGSVLITGGFSTNPTGTVNTAERFTPATGQWSSLTNTLSAARQEHSAVLLADGKVIVAGGWNGGATASADVFDPTANTFTPTQNNLSIARRKMGAVLLNNGKVLFVGGNDYNPGLGIIADYPNAELYDPTTSRFTATSSLSVPRISPTATLLANGNVLVTGGATTASAEIYDPSTGQFSATTGAPGIARIFGSAVLLPSGKVLITGGFESGSNAITNSAELFDPVTSRFTATTSPMNDAREGSTVTVLPAGVALIMGGALAANGSLSTAEFYSPVTNSFVRVTGAMGEARTWHTATLLNNGKVLLVGGASTVSPVALATSSELFW